MRQLAVTLAFALLSLGFAPAPFPKAERVTHYSSEAALVRACLRRLDELDAELDVVEGGGRFLIRYRVDRAGYGGSVLIAYAKLLPTLRGIVANAERSLNAQGPGRER